MANNWTEEKVSRQKSILKNQLETNNGRFGMFVLRTFRFIQFECDKNNSNWCYAKKVGGKRLTSYVYDGPEDHMAFSVIENVKDSLKKMGYIRYRKENNEWKLYISKQIDFCDINQYVNDTPDDKDFYQRVYEHLSKTGIKIYSYNKRCWKCGKDIKVYSYFLGKQLELEMGKEYIPHRYDIKHKGLFDRTGLGIITQLDEYLSSVYPNIKFRFSKEMKESYYMNCCQFCDAHQGINFVVYSPTELMNIDIDKLRNYECNTIDIEGVGIDKNKIKKLYY